MKLGTILQHISVSQKWFSMDIQQLTHLPNEVKDHTLLFLWKPVNNKGSIAPTDFFHCPAIIVTDIEEYQRDTIPVIHVENARREYAYAFAAFFEIDFSRTCFIGITGTNGKTTTAMLLAQILKKSGKKVGTFLTGEISIDDKRWSDPLYSMTTPDVPLLYPAICQMIREGCEYIIMEVSAHALTLEKTAPIPFSVGIFTNLSAEHLDFYPKMENYYQAKKKLFYQTKRAFINVDDAYGRRLWQEISCPKTDVGVLYPASVCAKCVSDDGLQGSSFLYREKALSFIQPLQLLGLYNIYNAILALRVAIDLGVPPKDAKAHLANVISVGGRLEKISDFPMVYVDYAHTPAALESVLKFLKKYKMADQRLLLLLGCGGNRDRKKRPEMGTVAERYADFTVITSDNPRNEAVDLILDDLEAGLSHKNKYIRITDRKEAMTYLFSMAKDSDILLLAGKGREPYILDKTGYHEYSEIETALSLLKGRTKENPHES